MYHKFTVSSENIFSEFFANSISLETALSKKPVKCGFKQKFVFSTISKQSDYASKF